MKTLVVAIGFVACLSSITLASVPAASYSVNFHFIPALISSPCTFATVWTPMNMTCAMCFCLNGRISRCVPQPGCNPAGNSTTTTTTTTTTPNPNPGASPVLIPGPETGNASMPSLPVMVSGDESGNGTQLPVNETLNGTSTAAPPSGSTAPGRFRLAKFPKTVEKY